LIAIAQDVWMLIAGRTLCGLGMGMGGTIHPVYVCELTSPAFRGALAASGVVMITGGILAVYVLGTFLQWKVVAWVCLTVPLVMAALVFLIPEAPGWLVRKGLYGQADKALSWLRREEEEFATERLS